MAKLFIKVLSRESFQSIGVIVIEGNSVLRFIMVKAQSRRETGAEHFGLSIADIGDGHGHCHRREEPERQPFLVR